MNHHVNLQVGMPPSTLQYDTGPQVSLICMRPRPTSGYGKHNFPRSSRSETSLTKLDIVSSKSRRSLAADIPVDKIRKKLSSKR